MRWFLVAFAVSRIAFWLAGLRFDAGHVGQMMHFVDVGLLRERLWESVVHLQGQPPLMSLVMGTILKVSGDHFPAVMHGFNLAIGVLIGWTMIRLLSRFGFNGAAATTAAVAFSLLPACLAYENYWFFSYPLTWLLLLLCERSVAAAQEDTFTAWSGLFFVAAALVLLKNVFHPLWMVALVALGIRTCSRSRRVLLAACLPLVLVLAWPVKNAIVFGTPDTASWVGFGLARKTWHRLPLQERISLAQKGVLDPVTAVPIYGDVATFGHVVPAPPPSGIPILDRETKESGWTNFHHAVYGPASRRMRDEALRLIKEHPGDYLDDVARTCGVLFQPAGDWLPVAVPYEQIHGWAGPIDAVLHAEVLLPLRPWGVLVVCVVVLALPACWRALRHPRRRSPEDRFLALAVGLMLWVFGLGVFLDTDETMRLRFITDGVLWVSVLTVGRRVLLVLRLKKPAAA